MTLINECIPGGFHLTGKQWCRDTMDTLGEQDVFRFPHAILEIKLQDVEETPDWVANMIRECDAVQVYKFSKFQQAMGYLHGNIVPEKPHWYEQLQEYGAEHRQRLREDQVQTVATPSTRRVRDALYSPRTGPAAAAAAGSGSVSDGKAILDTPLLEPKVMFANERTYLHYLQKGLFLSIVSMMMMRHPMSSAWGKLGLVLGAVTVTYLIWSYGVFLGRMQVIRKRRNVKKYDRFDEPRGPMVIFAMILTILGVTGLYFAANFQLPDDAQFQSLFNVDSWV